MVRRRSEKIETYQIDFHATKPDTATPFPSCHPRCFPSVIPVCVHLFPIGNPGSLFLLLSVIPASF